MPYSYYENIFGKIGKIKKHKTYKEAKERAEYLNYINRFNFSLGSFKYSKRKPKDNSSYL
jgi:hypothetical protein